MRILLFIVFLICSILSITVEFIFPQESILQAILNGCSLLVGGLMFLYFMINETELTTKLKEYYQYSFVKDDTIKKMEKEIDQKNQVIIDYTNEIDELKKEYQSLTEANSPQEEIDRYTKRITQLNSDLTNKEIEINALKREVKKSKTAICFD